jgi:hypothetical protein
MAFTMAYPNFKKRPENGFGPLGVKCSRFEPLSLKDPFDKTPSGSYQAGECKQKSAPIFVLVD